MVEFFDVRNADEASFRKAWAAGAPVGAVLYRALLPVSLRLLDQRREIVLRAVTRE